jgi:hypothetical protein
MSSDQSLETTQGQEKEAYLTAHGMSRSQRKDFLDKFNQWQASGSPEASFTVGADGSVVITPTTPGTSTPQPTDDSSGDSGGQDQDDSDDSPSLTKEQRQEKRKQRILNIETKIDALRQGGVTQEERVEIDRLRDRQKQVYAKYTNATPEDDDPKLKEFISSMTNDKKEKTIMGGYDSSSRGNGFGNAGDNSTALAGGANPNRQPNRVDGTGLGL